MICSTAVLFSILLISGAATQQLRSPNRRNIAMKENIPDLPPRVHDNAKDFLYFVQKSDLFIDKSHYIAYLLQIPERVLVVTGPRGWGKTFNWGMAASFLSTEYDEVHHLVPLNKSKNYHLFANGELPTEDNIVQQFQDPLAIAQSSDIINEYLGKHVVIELNFANIRGECVKDMLSTMEDAIVTAFHKHSYLTAIFSEIKTKSQAKEAVDEASRCDDLFWKVVYGRSLQGLRLVHSVKTLAMMLHKYMKKKVYIFIDAYDYPITQLFSSANFPETHKAQFLHNYDRFMYCTFVDNPYYEKAFFTGAIRLDKQFFFPKFRDIKYHHCLDQELYSFYGFSRRETEETLKYADISPSRMNQIITKCYGGFTVSNTNKTVYNPGVITKAIRSGELCGCWWKDEFVERVLGICLRNRFFYDDFISLINNNGMEIKMDAAEEIKIIELKMLRNVMQYENLSKVVMSVDMVTAVFKFLHLWGYLVKSDIPGASPNTYFLRFPDNDIMKEKLAKGLI